MAFDNPDIEFSDEGGDYNTKTLSIQEIVLRHLRKISDICCKEFTGGYWQKKPIKTPGGIMFTEEYHEDVRACYCNAVDFLIDVLYPKGDKDFKKYVDDNENIDDKTPIEQKVINKRKTFREISKMLERTNYFQTIAVGNE